MSVEAEVMLAVASLLAGYAGLHSVHSGSGKSNYAFRTSLMPAKLIQVNHRASLLALIHVSTLTRSFSERILSILASTFMLLALKAGARIARWLPPIGHLDGANKQAILREREDGQVLVRLLLDAVYFSLNLGWQNQFSGNARYGGSSRWRSGRGGFRKSQ